MNFSRIKKMPFSRLVKKVLGYDEIYAIAIRKGYPGMLLDDRIEPFSIIKGNKDYWYADPILYSFQGKNYLFAEAYSRTKFRGHIVAMEIFDDMSHTEFMDVIMEPYHMSFPMTFSWNGDIYMIPETSENNSLNLYKAVSFPYQWELNSIIHVSKKYVDTVVIEKDKEKVKLLTSEVSNSNPLLVKYQIFTLFFNALDELVPDVEFKAVQKYNLRDRCAGKLFSSNNLTILPTQTSTEIDYGVNLVFRDYSDKDMKTIAEYGPQNIKIDGIDSNNIMGIHSYAATEQYEIIDVRFLKFDPLCEYRKIIWKFFH